MHVKFCKASPWIVDQPLSFKGQKQILGMNEHIYSFANSIRSWCEIQLRIFFEIGNYFAILGWGEDYLHYSSIRKRHKSFLINISLIVKRKLSSWLMSMTRKDCSVFTRWDRRCHLQIFGYILFIKKSKCL